MDNSSITSGQERKISELVRDELHKLKFTNENAQLLISRGGDFQKQLGALMLEMIGRKWTYPYYRKKIYFGGSYCPIHPAVDPEEGYLHGNYMAIRQGFCLYNNNRFMEKKWELPSADKENEFLISLWCELAGKARLKVGDIVEREEEILSPKDKSSDVSKIIEITPYKVLAVEQDTSRKEFIAHIEADDQNAYLRIATNEELIYS